MIDSNFCHKRARRTRCALTHHTSFLSDSIKASVEGVDRIQVVLVGLIIIRGAILASDQSHWTLLSVCLFEPFFIGGPKHGCFQVRFSSPLSNTTNDPSGVA